MRKIQGNVISIAGLDPSAGAGLLADIKTFEQTGVYGCGMATCITYQTDMKFEGLHWLDMEELQNQFQPLAHRFKFEYAKIGLIENADMLIGTIKMLKDHNPEIRIIWDPVLKTSSGFSVHGNDFVHKLSPLIDQLFLVTPNMLEANILDLPDLVSKTNVLVTGGHSGSPDSVDILYSKAKVIEFNGPRLAEAEKHGSGCVLSAAITAFLALGNTLEASCGMAKDYATQYLTSSTGLLGHHHQIKIMDTYAIAY